MPDHGNKCLGIKKNVASDSNEHDKQSELLTADCLSDIEIPVDQN